MNKFSSSQSTFQAYRRVVRLVNCNRTIFTGYSLQNKNNDENEQNKDNLKGKETDSAEKKKETEKKLNDLLLMMSKVSTKSVSNIQVPKPREFGKIKYEKRKAEIQEEVEEMEKQELGFRLEKAAQNVADSLGGDKKKTEKELLDLYLRGKPSTDENVSLSDLLTTMKVEKVKESSRADQLRQYDQNRPDGQRLRRIQSRPTSTEKIDIFGELPFKFFTRKEKADEFTSTVLNTWDYLDERDLRLCVTHPPANIFEQYILWTNQGKLWRFPINNEQDWPEESDIDFTEHVFLERHIEPWCPKSGPLRHFMELVCTGLSKNPYLSVAEKRAHISFYENYFRSKNALLTELEIPSIAERSEQVATE